jgi:hypothetical protein
MLAGRCSMDGSCQRVQKDADTRYTTRYTEDSPIPKHSLISDVGMLVLAYGNAMSRCSSGLNLGRREPAGRAVTCPYSQAQAAR